jgi:transmembrane sensor
VEERNIRQILKRYLIGNADKKDLNAVDNWYNLFDSEELVAISAAEAEATKQEIWNKVQPVLEEEKKVRRLPTWLKVAAMIIIIAGAAMTVLFIRNRQKSGSLPIAYTTISTGTGERKKITIQDGSQLLLNAGTTIRLQNDLSKERKIEVADGEVFFEVKTDAQRPFIITSGGLTTTVLGTSFNISAYAGLNNLSIGVVSGKVRVAGPSAMLSILEKDEELVYNKTSQHFKKVALDESLTSWQDGRLILNDLSFYEMSVIMKKNYGIDITTARDDITHTRYTTELLTAMSPLEAVQVLAAIHKLKITTAGNKIFLHK